MPNIVLTVTNQQAARISTAFGKALNLGRDATPDEVKQYLIGQVKRVVHQEELNAAIAAVPPPNLGDVT